MSNNLHLDFIDVTQLHSLTKIDSKSYDNPFAFSNGFVVKGYPAVGGDGVDQWLLIRQHLDVFQTSVIMKVEYKPDRIILETLNSIYELRPLEGPRLDDQE